MGSKIDYQILTWGPCVLKLKITDEFFELLKKESEASVKEELSYTHRLAGIIQKEYKLRDSFYSRDDVLPKIPGYVNDRLLDRANLLNLHLKRNGTVQTLYGEENLINFRERCDIFPD